MDNHHICPKANDLFPEYRSFKNFPWNKICLTPRQHFIAHLILACAYKGSQSKAILFMMGKISNSEIFEIRINSRMYDRFKKEYSRYTSNSTSGINHWSKQPGKIHNWVLNPPSRFKGKEHKQESKDAIRNAQLGELNHFFNKRHTSETKDKISSKRKSCMWITNGTVDQLHHKLEPLPPGFKKGRTNGTMAQRIWITNGKVDKQWSKKEKIPDGWEQGRANCFTN